MKPETLVPAPILDDSFRRYVALLLRHHHLLSERPEDDSEIEAVEDEMTELWDELNPAQRQSLSGLGSDLNWIRRGCQPAPRGRRAEDVTPQDLQSLVSARDEGDWHALLHELRTCAPSMPAFELADLRALAWSKIGFMDLNRVFRELAAQLQNPCDRQS